MFYFYYYFSVKTFLILFPVLYLFNAKPYIKILIAFTFRKEICMCTENPPHKIRNFPSAGIKIIVELCLQRHILIYSETINTASMHSSWQTFLKFYFICATNYTHIRPEQVNKIPRKACLLMTSVY